MRRAGAIAVVVAGSAALLARPWLVRLPADPVTVLVILFVILGVVGATWRLPAGQETAARAEAADGSEVVDGSAVDGRAATGSAADGPAADGSTADGPAADGSAAGGDRGRPREAVPAWLALGIGLGAFGVGRLLAVGTLPVAPLLLRSVALNTLAAVSEEAFFRRLAYGVANGWGPVVAVVGSAAIFAAVHVTVWGWGVLPLDLAAGLVFGWQRWASGRWSVPAVTHVAANVLAVV